jgi:hypothetical protein
LFNTEDFRYRDVLDNLMEIGQELTYLKNVYNISKLGFAIDSSISNRHNVQDNFDQSSQLQNGQSIFKFQV